MSQARGCGQRVWGWDGRGGRVAWLLGWTLQLWCVSLVGKLEGWLHVSSKQVSLGTFSRNTRSGELGVEERRVKREKRNLHLSWRERGDDESRDGLVVRGLDTGDRWPGSNASSTTHWVILRKLLTSLCLSSLVCKGGTMRAPASLGDVMCEVPRTVPGIYSSAAGVLL